jgi:hypothetical protein
MSGTQRRPFGDVQLTSALPLKADIQRKGRHVSNVPTRDSCIATNGGSFDYLVGASDERLRHCQVERLGRATREPTQQQRERPVGARGRTGQIGVRAEAVKLPPARRMTAMGGLQTFRHLHACPGCFRPERMPGGSCTHWKRWRLSRRTREAVIPRAIRPCGSLSPSSPSFPARETSLHALAKR